MNTEGKKQSVTVEGKIHRHKNTGKAWITVRHDKRNARDCGFSELHFVKLGLDPKAVFPDLTSENSPRRVRITIEEI